MLSNLVSQFNVIDRQAGHEMIQKALTTATGVGGALIPENLEKVITDTVIRLSPEMALIDARKIAGKTHEFNRLTARPAAGGAMGENATTPITNSTTARATVELKVVRRKGKVTNFLLDTSEEYIDAAAYEMENELQAHVLDLIYYSYFGNKGYGDALESDGLEKMISTNRTVEVPTGSTKSSLAFLDNMIDASTRKGGARHRRAFLMSPEMLSLVSRLLTNVRLNQGLAAGGLSQVEINGGWRLNAYRDIPIIETTQLTPVETFTPTITLAGVNTGGGLSDDTYYLYMAPVTYEGEQLASAEETITLSGGGAAQRIRISLDAVHAGALSLKIYVGLVTGAANCPLVKQVSSFTYDASGSPTNDNGTGTEYIYIDSLAPSATGDTPTHLQADVPLVANATGYNPESVILWDLDPIQGLGKLPYTNRGGSRFNGLVTMEDLAKTDDFINFLVKSYCALTPAFEATSFWHRGLTISG